MRIRPTASRTTVRTRTRTRPRRAAVLAAAIAAGLALTACTTLPTSGPVQQGMTDAPTAGTIQYEATGPVAGAGPGEIIEGFLQAGAAGLSGDTDFEVARSFLTPGASTSWAPLSQVVISANDSPQVPVVTLPEEAADGADADADGTAAGEAPTDPEAPADGVRTLGPDDVDTLDRVQVRLGVVAVADVDGNGVYTAATSRTESELIYELVRTDGEWRIDSVPNGLLLAEVAFGNVFRSVPLMFLTPDLTGLVPDTRFVPTRNAVSHALDLLLAGPASWLAPGVATRVEPGTTLEQPGAGVVVAEDSAQAEVRLTGAEGASEDERALLYTQIRETLVSLPGIQGVSLWLDGNLYEPAQDAPAPVLDDDVPARMVALSDGELVVVTGDEVVPYVGAGSTGDGAAGDGAADGAADSSAEDVTGTGAVAPTDPGGSSGPTDPTDAAPADATPITAVTPTPPVLADLHRPAPAYDPDDGVAVLQGSSRLLHVAPDGEFTVLASGSDLLPPSQDRLGWIFTGERDNDGTLTAARADGASVQVDAELLAGRVIQVRLSRDGARAAVMTERDGAAQVRVAAVVRDADGVPLRLVPGPVLVGDLATGIGIVWADATVLAVLAAQDEGAVPSVRSVLVSGPVASVSSTAQAVSIAAGNGLGQLYLSTAENRLLLRVSLRWEEVAARVTDPAFAG